MFSNKSPMEHTNKQLRQEPCRHLPGDERNVKQAAEGHELLEVDLAGQVGLSHAEEPDEGLHHHGGVAGEVERGGEPHCAQRGPVSIHEQP